MSIDSSNLPPNIRAARDRKPDPRTPGTSFRAPILQKGGDAKCTASVIRATSDRQDIGPIAQLIQTVVSSSAAAESNPQAAANQDDAEPQDAYVGKEKDLHVEFERDMQRRGAHLVHARTDTESTIAVGAPDFHCMFTGTDGVCRGAAIEFKTAGKKLRETQLTAIAEMRRKRIPVKVCWRLEDAIAFASAQLGC